MWRRRQKTDEGHNVAKVHEFMYKKRTPTTNTDIPWNGVAKISNQASNSTKNSTVVIWHFSFPCFIGYCHFILFSRSLETGTHCFHLIFVNRQRSSSRMVSQAREECKRSHGGEVIATAKQNKPHRRTAILTAILVKRDHDHAAHVANSPVTKTSRWRSLRLPVHLSLPYLILLPLFSDHPKDGHCW
jgi:hypothetical protein